MAVQRARDIGPNSARVAAELHELRRGRGVLSDDIDTRVGPLLKEFCGMADSDDVAVVRAKLSSPLRILSERLPDDLGHAVRVGLALGDTVTDRFLKDRMCQLATDMRRDPRTAMRRLDEGLRRLAEIIVSGSTQASPETNEFAPEGWYVDILRANLLLDRDPPQVIEHRRIVATATGLDTVLASVTAPPDSAGPDQPTVRTEVMYGGVLLDAERVRGGHYRCHVRLPLALEIGQAHEYALVFTFDPYWYLPTYYALTPFRRYDRFELSARFDRAAPPEKTWRLNGIPPSIIEEFTADAELRTIDAVGEVHVEFSALKAGLSYGLRWSA
jgi:hypothetical protein